jgi:hypothetical protein
MREQMLPVSMKWLDVLISDQYCGGSRSFVANVGGTKLCWVWCFALSMTSFACSFPNDFDEFASTTARRTNKSVE